MELLAIGEVAARSGMAPSALRYYEQQGLIAAVRTPGGARRFPRGVLRRLAVVRAARNVGLSLTEIRAALDSLPRPARRADRRPDRAARRTDVVHRLRLPLAGEVRVVHPGGRRRHAGGRGPVATACPAAAVPAD